jgi:hypothetical protein
MKILRATIAVLLACSPGLSAQLQAEPALDFSGVDTRLVAPATEVLVLGTPHLDQVETPYPLELLEPLLKDLEQFDPDIIAIETLSGETCEILTRYRGRYPGVAERYCHSARPALDALGLDRPAAVQALQQALDEFPSSPQPEDRRRLAALYLATGDEWSAVVQWRQLDADQRTAGDGMSPALVELIGRLMRSREESNLIAATLAARLGLRGVHPMDDHTADVVLARSDPEVWSIVASLWGKNIGDVSGKEAAAVARIGQPGAVKDFYRLLNSPEMQDLYVRNDFGQAAAASGETIAARDYLAWWQVRNLRMAANIVEAAGNRPDAKVLVIVGASHKPYFEAYLDQMHHIELVDVDEVLTR